MRKFLPRLFVLLLALLGFTLFSIDLVNAQEDFILDLDVSYKFNQKGNALVENNFRLENAQSDKYASSYLITLWGIEAENVLAQEGEKRLDISQKKEGESSKLEVLFSDVLAGKGNTRNFKISFETKSFAKKIGESWEIQIPRFGKSGNFRSFRDSVSVPSSFNKEAYVFPNPTNIKLDSNSRTYFFEDGEKDSDRLILEFGEKQNYSFDLNYDLENPLNTSAFVEIAVPPDTSYQKVYYSEATLKPSQVVTDNDGNWLFKYLLSPRQKITVSLKGFVKIYNLPVSANNDNEENLKGYLGEEEYWQVNDAEIKNLALRLKTPRAIYDYVSSKLIYDEKRVKPNISRMGAKAALANPGSAVCMEYTDLFIALSRAAGIPAREINGFAYSENPKLEPLSLVADVLHAWPEYWNENQKRWVPVDPTWGSTSKGRDYFEKFDLRHFAFVIHGSDSVKPYPAGSYRLGSSPQKNVFVKLESSKDEEEIKPKISVETLKNIPFSPSKIKVTAENPKGYAHYNLDLNLLFDSVLVKKVSIASLPAFAKHETEIEVPFSFLGKNTPKELKIILGSQTLSVPTFYNEVVILNILVLSLIVFLFSTFFVVKIIVINKSRNNGKKSENISPRNS